MSFFEKMFGSENSGHNEQEQKNTCPVCQAPLVLDVAQEEENDYGSYKCANGHQVLQ